MQDIIIITIIDIIPAGPKAAALGSIEHNKNDAQTLKAQERQD